MLTKLTAVLLAAFSLTALIPGCAGAGSSLEYGNLVGNRANDFSLMDMAGNAVTLSTFSGRPVMVNFWSTT